MEFVVKKREKYEPVERWEGTIDYSGRLAHALKRVQRMGIAV